MKIVQLVTQLEAGGAQRAAILLADGLRERGHEVETWFLYRKRHAFEEAPGVRLMANEKPSPFGGLAMLSTLLRGLRAAAPDALITHTHYANVIGQVAAWTRGIRRRVAVQQNTVDSYPRMARRIDRVLGGTRVYSDVVAVSRAVALSMGAYSARYRSKIRVVHNAVSFPTREMLNGSDPRLAYGIPVDAQLLVNVGRLHYQKNQAVLLDALTRLPGVHLLIVGEGELRRDLEDRVDRLGLGDRVHLPGELPWEVAMALASQADAFVFPSLFEGMSLALMEAMALGLPIIASDIPPNREAAEDVALFVAADSPEAIAHAVRLVLDAPDRVADMRRASARRGQDFHLSRMVDDYEALIV
jgi:glycosyltransferase involved in cell wall biosynthesis